LIAIWLRHGLARQVGPFCVRPTPPGVIPREVCRELADDRHPGAMVSIRAGRRYDLTLPIDDVMDLSQDGSRSGSP
jgi:hypothetical protein